MNFIKKIQEHRNNNRRNQQTLDNIAEAVDNNRQVAVIQLGSDDKQVYIIGEHCFEIANAVTAIIQTMPADSTIPGIMNALAKKLPEGAAESAAKAAAKKENN